MSKFFAFVSALIALSSLLGAHPHSYNMCTVVTEILLETDEVLCEDLTGNIFAFYGTEDWRVGDIACLLMDDMGTATVLDDEIIKARRFRLAE